MSEFVLPPFLAAMADRNRITEDDVMSLRQDHYVDGLVSPEDAVSILAVDTACRNKCLDWNAFFRETLSDFIVHKTEPAGSVSEKNARWLISAVSRDHNVASRTELDMLIDVIEKARSVPGFFSAYCLKQVADAVIQGRGPLMKNRIARSEVITAKDVELVRRILEGNPEHSVSPISRDEAEILFILNDRSIEAQNDPAWHDLFVKAIASFMLGLSGYTVPSRKTALAKGAWLEQAERDAAKLTFERMVGDGIRRVLPTYLETAEIHSVYNRRSKERLAEDQAEGLVHATEAEWLASRIGQNGFMRRNEKALLAALKAENTTVRPEFEELLAKVA